MAEIKPSPRNPYVGGLSDALSSAKRFGNKYEVKDWVPLLGGTGLGDLFLGGSPELLDDISYQGYRGLVKGGNEATGGIGTYTLDPRVADAAFLAGDVAGVGALSKAATKKGVKTLTERLLEQSMNMSRREAMKKIGAGAAVAALPAAALTVGRKAGKEVAPKVADNAALQTAKKYKFNSLADYMKDVDRRALESNKSYDDAYRAIDWDKHIGPEPLHPEETLYFERKGILDEDAALYDKAKRGISFGDGDDIEKTLNEFSPKAKEQMKAYKEEADIRGADWADYWWEGQ